MIRYGEKFASTELLGPGNRAALWVYGCCFDCPGCIAYNYKHGPCREATAEELADWFLTTGADGLTISGGEPMLQPEALTRMIRRIREKADIGVLVYTGFLYETLLEKAERVPAIKAFLGEIDLLIDGPYLEEQNHNEPFRGSTNQRVLPLTDRYLEQVRPYYFDTVGRRVALCLNEEKTLLVGIPSRDQADIWQKIKQLADQKPGEEA